MYRRMLVPLDGSKLAEMAFVYAKELAGRLHMDLVLFHVCQDGESERCAMQRVYVQRAAEMVEDQSRGVQRDSGMEPGDREVGARAEVAVGHSAEEILRYAEENRIDLILMTSHGESGVTRWALGSVADKVLRASTVPVWLVPARVGPEIVYDRCPNRTMLVPLDVSELAECVLPHVEALTKQRGTEVMEVVLIGVVEPLPTPSQYAHDVVCWEEHVAHSTRINERYLARVRGRLERAGLRVRAEVLLGRPADEIVRYANTNPCNMVVMSTHGRSGLDQSSYGCVTGRVLQDATRPVLLIRPTVPIKA